MQKEQNNVPTQPPMPSDNNNLTHLRIAVSYDMGWNTFSSGNFYNSLSGQAVMYGCLTGKPIAWCILAKQCNVCQKVAKHNKKPNAHVFPRNYKGSSKAMEAEAARRMLVSLWTQGYKITYIVGDDDATTRAILQPRGHRKSNKGKLDHSI